MQDSPPRLRFAVLVDAQNVPANHLKHILVEVEKHGEPRVRLLFGTADVLKSQAPHATAHGFRPVLQYTVATRKNAADIALVIQAMELLHSGKADAFCIVSSDSDFQPLATYLREDGRFVLGIGKEDTPDALKSACTRFVPFEVLDHEEEKTKPMGSKAKEPIRDVAALRTLVQPAYQAAQGEDGWAPLAAVGSQLQLIDPGFDARKFGRPRLSVLLRDLGDFEFRPEGPPTPNETVLVRARAH